MLQQLAAVDVIDDVWNWRERDACFWMPFGAYMTATPELTKPGSIVVDCRLSRSMFIYQHIFPNKTFEIQWAYCRLLQNRQLLIKAGRLKLGRGGAGRATAAVILVPVDVLMYQRLFNW